MTKKYSREEPNKKYLVDKSLDSIEMEKLQNNAKNDVCYEFALRLRNCLDEKNMNSNDLVRFLECSPSTVSSYINAEALPNAEYLLKIADIFDVSTDFLLGKTKAKSYKNNEISKKLGLSDESIDMLIELKELSTESFVDKERIETIDFLIKNELKNNIFEYISIYLWHEFEASVSDFEGFSPADEEAENYRKEHVQVREKKSRRLYEFPVSYFQKTALVTIEEQLKELKGKNRY